MFETPLKANLFYIFSLLTPFLVKSTKKALTFLVSSFFAKQMIRSLSAFPIHLLFPFKTYPFYTFLAVVVRLEASEPISISVKPQPPISSKFINFGR